MQAAAAYDSAAPIIHPKYDAVQDAILAAIPYDTSQAFWIVDLGGGSGRLVERLLERFQASIVWENVSGMAPAAKAASMCRPHCRSNAR